MKKFIITLIMLLFIPNVIYSQASRTRQYSGDKALFDTIGANNDASITFTSSIAGLSVDNADSLGHVAATEYALRDTLNSSGQTYADTIKANFVFKNMVIADSVFLTSALIKALIKDSLTLSQSITNKFDKSAFADSMAAVDSTYITNDKLGFEDINNLPELLDLKLNSNSLSDSLYAIDSLRTRTGIITGNIYKTSITNKDSAYATKGYIDRLIVGGGMPAAAFGDSLRDHKSLYLMIPYRFSVDTSLTISAKDSVDIFYDIESSEQVIVARAKESANGIQNATVQTFYEINEDITGIDSLNIWVKTSHAAADSNKVNVYAGILNRFTGVITITDSSVNNSGTTYAEKKLYLGDDTINKNDILVLRFRFWSINETKMVKLKRPYLVTK